MALHSCSSVMCVDKLTVGVGSKTVLKDVSFSVDRGSILFLLGPNGTGKTSLLRTLIGYPGYSVVSGRILFEGEDITHSSMEYRVSKGLAISHQIPPKLTGVRVVDLLNSICRRTGCSVDEIADELEIGYLLNREFGKGFSGGELKRIEIATVVAQRPKLALIDEPDSGVDVDSIAVIAKALKKLVDLSTYKSIIVITHSAAIAKHIRPTHVCIMLSGSVRLCGDDSILDEVFNYGFRGVAK
ncbi:MAG: ATP-binding cassette domain-containing protein [Ignisphaera sp.]